MQRASHPFVRFAGGDPLTDLATARELVQECECEDGCPSCVGPGGENGVVGRYNLGDATIRLLLIESPTASRAAKGLKALQGSSLSDLVTSAASGNLLGAVFGKVDVSQAQALLQEALK